MDGWMDGWIDRWEYTGEEVLDQLVQLLLRWTLVQEFRVAMKRIRQLRPDLGLDKSWLSASVSLYLSPSHALTLSLTHTLSLRVGAYRRGSAGQTRTASSPLDSGPTAPEAQ